MFVYFLRDHHNYLLVGVQLLISGKSVIQYALYSLIYSPLQNNINREQHEKHLYHQSSYYQNTEIWSLSTPSQLLIK